MSHMHGAAAQVMDVAAGRKIVLAGNPNVGKSIFFGTYSGMYVEVSNFPGTTVEITAGRLGPDAIFDTPGVYGVGSFNDEERVARDVILSADVVINVVDSTHLERDLFLTCQLADMGIPMVVALNFSDEARDLGITIDVPLLSERLGVPVIPCAAVKGRGLLETKDAIARARPGISQPEIDAAVTHLLDRVDVRPEALMVAEGDEAVSARHGVTPLDLREMIYTRRRERVNRIVEETVKTSDGAGKIRETLGRLCLEPLTGLPIMALVLWASYVVIGVWVAGDVVGFTEETLLQGHYEPWIRALMGRIVDEPSVAGQFLIGEFGLLTMTVTYLLGLLFPLVIGFYLVLSLLEDSGYLPRLAAFVDRGMNSIGLNGRAIIPVILGFGCVQLGSITTRILGTNRERTIASAILYLVIPCSAQIGVIAGMLAAAGPLPALVYALVIVFCLVLVGTVMARFVPGETSPLLIDLPPMRIPRIDNVVRKTFVRAYHFMKEAVPWFAAGSIIVTLLVVTGGLTVWQELLAPLTVGWLKLPKEASTAFVMGMVRRDFGAAGLTDLAMNPWQILVSLVVITLFVPCIASLMVLFKERGFKEAAAIWVGSWIFAFAIGGLLALVVL